MLQQDISFDHFQHFLTELIQSNQLNKIFGELAEACQQKDGTSIAWKKQVLGVISNSLQAFASTLLEPSQDTWHTVTSWAHQQSDDTINLSEHQQNSIQKHLDPSITKLKEIELVAKSDSLVLQKNYMILLPIVNERKVKAVFVFFSLFRLSDLQKHWLNHYALLLKNEFSLVLETNGYDKAEELAAREVEIKAAFTKLQTLETYQYKLEQAEEHIQSLLQQQNQAPVQHLEEQLQEAFQTIDRLEKALFQAKQSAPASVNVGPEQEADYAAKLDEAFLTIERLEKKLIEAQIPQESADSANVDELKTQIFNLQTTEQLNKQIIAKLQEENKRLLDQVAESVNVVHDQEQIRAEKQKAAQLAEQLAAVTARLQLKEQEHQQLIHQNGQAYQEKYDNAQLEIEQLRAELSALTTKNNQQEEEREQLLAKHALLESSVQEVEQQNQEFVQKLEKQALVHDTNQNTFQKEKQALARKMQELENEKQALAQKTQELQNEKQVLTQKTQELENERQTLTQKTQELAQQNSNVVSKLAQKEEALVAVNTQLETQQQQLQEVSSLKLALEAKEQAYQTLHEQLTLSKQGEEQLQELKTQYQLLQEKYQQQQGTLDSKLQLLEGKKQEVSQLHLQLQEYEQQTVAHQEGAKQEQTRLVAELQRIQSEKETIAEQLGRKEKEISDLEEKISDLEMAEYKINAANLMVRDLANKLQQKESELMLLRSQTRYDY